MQISDWLRRWPRLILRVAKKNRIAMSHKDHVFTLGIEEEFQIIDPETRELRSIGT